MAYRDFRKSVRSCICPVCGNSFVPAPMHIYRDELKRSLVCSYKCVIESERRREAVLEAKRQRRAQRKAARSMSKKADARERAQAAREERAERNRQICSVFESGVSTGDIAEQFGLSLSRINAIIRASR